MGYQQTEAKMNKTVTAFSMAGCQIQPHNIRLCEFQNLKRSVRFCFQNPIARGFHGGRVIKNSPCNAGEMGSIPGLGRSHIATEQLSPCNTATEPVLLSPRTSTREATAIRSSEPQLERSPCLLQLEKSLYHNKDSVQPKITINK